LIIYKRGVKLLIRDIYTPTKTEITGRSKIAIIFILHQKPKSQAEVR